MKKKMYESPWMDIVFIRAATPLLAVSDVIRPGGDNEEPGAPGFDLNEATEMRELLFY